MRSRLGRPLLTLMCRYVRRQWEAYRHYRKRSATTAAPRIGFGMWRNDLLACVRVV